jgi:hypothetical protein
MNKSGIAVDFRRILRFHSGLPEWRSDGLNDSVIEDMLMNLESPRIVSRMHQRFEDSSLIIVKSIFFRDLIEVRLIENKIENLINLRHPCIAAPIGFVCANDHEGEGSAIALRKCFSS